MAALQKLASTFSVYEIDRAFDFGFRIDEVRQPTSEAKTQGL
jgi:hypothetical protein